MIFEISPPPFLLFHPAAYRRSAGTKPVKFDFRHLCTTGHPRHSAKFSDARAREFPMTRQGCVILFPLSLFLPPLPSSFSTVTSARPLENPWKVLVFRERTNNCENLVNLAPKRAKGEGFASKTRDFFIDGTGLQTGGECGLGWRTMEQTYPRLPTILELGIRRATYTESVLIARGSTARF